MARSKSSDRWMKEHVSDYYVQKAQQDGYRSRAAYKLLELNDRDHLLKQGTTVVDLGSAPGGWSQVAAGLVGESGKVYALDILPMDALADVEFIQGDFCEDAVYERLMGMIGNRKIDLVISDMAPNISGVGSVDQAKSMYLCELALDFAKQVLHKGGNFAIKVFQGEGFDEYMREVRNSFTKVQIRKPKASRPRSREVYIVAHNFKM